MATEDTKGKGSGRSASATGTAQGSPGPGEARRSGERKEKEDDGIYQNLVDELDSVSGRWEEFGLKLGVRKSVLNVIKNDYIKETDGTKKCFSEMLYKWFRNSTKSPNQIWITVCNVLTKMDESQLASEVAQKHDLYPKITRQPQDVHAALGGTIAFSCEASASGSTITYEWFHIMCDGREVKKEATSAKLDIKEVIEGDRGNYTCVVKNVFGAVKSQSAELIIGLKFNGSNLTDVLADIKVSDWPEVGEGLAIAREDLRSAFVRGILKRIQKCPKDKINLWKRIAQALEEMEGCDFAAQKAKENAGKELNESTVTEMFKEVGIKNPDWCRIGEKLGYLATCQRHWEKFEENQQNTEGAVEGSESGMQKQCPKAQQAVATIFRHKNTWEKLAKALERIQLQGYDLVAEKAKKNAEVEITPDTMSAVFRESSTVNWHTIAGKFSSFSEPCLIEMLMIWHSKEKCQDPRIIWRKLAVSLEENINGPKAIKNQLGIGYKLRWRSGVGLELTPDNFYKILKKAGIKDWSTIVSGLKVDVDPNSLVRKLVSFVPDRLLPWKPASVHTEILAKWPKPQSWEELARVIEDSKDGPVIAQKTREMSGSGGFPKIRYLATPELKGNNVKSGTVVTFICEARGAPPLKYNWTHNGDDLNLQDSMTVKLKVTRGGKYNCRVENVFGCDTLENPIDLKCGDPPICKFDHQKVYIEIGKKLNLQCKARGSGQLHYTWLHNDKELPKEEYHESNLCKQKTLESDAGNYECHVASEFGNATSIVEVNVGEHPEIKSISLQGPNKRHYERGVSLLLYCEASGTQELRYTWQLRRGRHTTPVGNEERLTVTTAEDSEGDYMCHIKNDFGEVTSKPIGIRVGDKPKIKAPPKIAEKAVQGEQVRLTCEAEGQGPFKYVWMHNNQTLVKEAGSCKKIAELMIERMTDAHQGKYKCCFTNAFGFNVSEPVTLLLEITLEEIMKQLCPDSSARISQKWYMLGILLDIEKAILDRISRSFATSENSLQEVIRSWLEKKPDPQKPCSWATIRDAVCRMGYAKLAQDLDAVPKIEAPLKVEGIVAHGKRITLTCKCKATGKPKFHFTWLHDDIEIPEINNSKFTIDSMDESDEGEYKCKVSNEVGSAISEAVTLKPGLQIEEGILAQKQNEEDAAKPKIEAPLRVEGNVAYGEKITLTCTATGKPPFEFTWVYNDVETHVNNSKFTIDSMDETNEGEYKCKVSNEVGFTISEPITLKPGLKTGTGSLTQKQAEGDTNYDAKDMIIKFEDLAGNVEELLTNPDSSGTESGVTDTAVSGIQAYLHLIKFKAEDIEKVEDLHSGIELLRQYWNYQRYHLLEKVINQFSSETAHTKMEEFINHFSIFQATTTLGDFVPSIRLEGSSDGEQPVRATLEEDPPIPIAKNPPFMNSFKMKLESKWATCTLRDADSLLLNLLPDTVSREFVWSSVAYREEENHAVCLEYLVSPTVVELLSKEMKKRTKSMCYMGILCVQVDSDEFKPEPYQDSLGRSLRLPPGYQPYEGSLERSLRLSPGFQSSITRSHFEEQGLEMIPLDIQSSKKQLEELKQQLEELKVFVTKCASKIQALEEDCATRNTYGLEIETLQTDLKKTNENLKKVSKCQKDKFMELSGDIGVLNKKVDRNQQIAKQVIEKRTGKPAPEMTHHERIKHDTTEERMKESALATAGGSTMTSDEQGHLQEPLDNTLIMKMLKEFREAQQEILEVQKEFREAQRHAESKITEESAAKISEESRGKDEELKSSGED